MVFLCAGIDKAAAYRVSGLVEFSYNGFESETGKSKFVSHYWTQTYNLNFSDFLLDPRIMRFSAGVGYTAVNWDKNGADSKSVLYDIHTAFFPISMISMDAFSTRSTQNIQSPTSITGADINTTSYGGTLYLRLGSRGRGNNNNGSNGNNNQGRTRFVLPDISASHTHADSESTTGLNPLHETRDDSRGTLYYRFNSAFRLNVDSSFQEYNNQLTGASYKIGATNLTSNIRVSPDAELKVGGSLTDRTTKNVAGYVPEDKKRSLEVNLNFREKNNVSQNYSYTYQDSSIPSTQLSWQQFLANINYRISEDITTHGGINYAVGDFKQKPNPLVAGDVGVRETLKSGGLFAGVTYFKLYTPDFMGPFGFNTGYDFGTGFSDYSSNTVALQGSGWYYTNKVQLGVSSVAWEKETVALSYSFSDKKDYSPLRNDMLLQMYRFTVKTTRIPRMLIQGNVSYTSTESKNSAGNVFLSMPSSIAAAGTPNAMLNEQRRAFTYDVSAVYTVSQYLNLSAGASKGQAKSGLFTLSTLQSVSDTEDEFIYGTANLAYPITRNLAYRALLQEEYRRTLLTKTRDHIVTTGLDYRIRMIIVSLEYRWWQSAPENGLRFTQQYYFARLSRPF